MTVKALIERLKAYPPNSIIYLEPQQVLGSARKMEQLCQYEDSKYREDGVYFE
jgi:hypothetical protein